MAKFKVGDSVNWNFLHGKVNGKVTEVKSDNSKGAETHYEVKSEKSGKTAVHKESALSNN